MSLAERQTIPGAPRAGSLQRAPMTRHHSLLMGAGLAAGVFTTVVSAACGTSNASADPGDAILPWQVATTIRDDSPPASHVEVTLTPRPGVTGLQRVNFAVPLAPGQLADAANVRVLSGETELTAARRSLAHHPDGSVRSVQLQVELAVAPGQRLAVRLGEAPTTPALSLIPAAATLEPSDGTRGPRVWAQLPARWLVQSGVTGPQVLESETAGTALDAWGNVCDFDNHDVNQFLSLQQNKDVWLYDRGTIMYRGHARRGDLGTLESAYRETAIYRARLTGTGVDTRIGVPGSASDVKYHYAQNLAIHYLLTGDDRFREAAEGIALRIDALWDPHYRGGGQFWTERHAGFALLAYVWARIVTDDRAAALDALAHDAVEAYLAVQDEYPRSWSDPDARCFAHETSCSPWMSAILADGLDAYAAEYGGAAGDRARAAIVKLGRILARDGRDPTGKPYYMLGVGSAGDTPDAYHEHWGEPAYVIAMAWHHGGRSESSLRTAAEQLLSGLRMHGVSPHLRSFNWQCRSALATPYYLR
jgi:hypothetical protein